VNTDRWYYRVFQSAPDLIRALLPGAAAASAGLALDPCEPGDRLYRFEALEQKEVSHRHDGVLWPRDGTGVAETGSAVFPVVLLEVQMQSDPGFQARLAAQSLRFVQRHPQVEHLELVVITPHRRLSLGSERPPRLLQAVLQEVLWINLEDLSRQPDLDPLLNLLTLPIRPESELAASSRQILASRPDLDTVVLPMLIQRFPELSEEQIMVIAGIPREEIRHTRAVQEWLAEGRQEGLQEGRQEGRQEGLQEGLQEGRREGRQQEAVNVTLRQLTRRCGPLSEATSAQIQALPLSQLEALAEALLDFQGPADLAAWLTVDASS
jgi:predicted transposase YdaD